MRLGFEFKKSISDMYGEDEHVILVDHVSYHSPCCLDCEPLYAAWSKSSRCVEWKTQGGEEWLNCNKD
jgi:hypothetical protein